MAKAKPRPMPRRHEVDEALNASIARQLSDHGLSPEQLSYDVRLYGHVTNDLIQRIGIGYEMHRDDMARPCFEIVDTSTSTDWRTEADAHVRNIAAHVRRLEDRRDSFPAAGDTALPRRAWDIHPIAASVLSLYKRLPAFDGRHRMDGEFGRIVVLEAAPGIRGCTIAYGDGVVRLVDAEFEGGPRLGLREGRLHLTVQGEYPETVVTAMRGMRPGRIAKELGRDPRTSRVRVTKVARTGMDGLQITFSDGLVPWDRRASGHETWRTKRLAA